MSTSSALLSSSIDGCTRSLCLSNSSAESKLRPHLSQPYGSCLSMMFGFPPVRMHKHQHDARRLLRHELRLFEPALTITKNLMD